MSGPRFHKVRHKALANFVDAHGLGDRYYRLLHHLVEEADWKTGVVDEFNKTTCANELGYGASSGRRTLAQQLARLQELEAVSVDRRTVTILIFGELVDNPHQPASTARLARGPADHNARSTRGSVADDARSARGSESIHPPLPGLSCPVEKDIDTDIDRTPSPYPSPTEPAVPEAKAKADTERRSAQQNPAATVLVAHIAARLAPSDRERFFTTADTGARVTLARLVDELLAQGWSDSDLVDELGGKPMPANPFSPAAVVLDRARRLVGQGVPPVVAARTIAAERDDAERADAVAEAERWARSLLNVEWDDDAELLDTIYGRFPDDDDLREAACQAVGWVAA